MKRSLLGLLAALVLGASAVVANPAVPAGASGVDVGQVQPADHDGKDKCGGEAKDKCEAKCGDEAKDRCEAKGEGRDKDGDDKDKKKGCSGDDDKDRCRHKDGDKDRHREGDKDRHREGDGRRCVGLIVICIG